MSGLRRCGYVFSVIFSCHPLRIAAISYMLMVGSQ